MPLDHSRTRVQHLSQAKPGARVIVLGFPAGEGLERRLTELGIPKGAEIEITSRMGPKGATIVAIHGSRIVIGADMAARIEVTALPGAH